MGAAVRMRVQAVRVRAQWLWLLFCAVAVWAGLLILYATPYSPHTRAGKRQAMSWHQQDAPFYEEEHLRRQEYIDDSDVVKYLEMGDIRGGDVLLDDLEPLRRLDIDVVQPAASHVQTHGWVGSSAVIAQSNGNTSHVLLYNKHAESVKSVEHIRRYNNSMQHDNYQTSNDTTIDITEHLRRNIDGNLNDSFSKPERPSKQTMLQHARKLRDLRKISTNINMTISTVFDNYTSTSITVQQMGVSQYQTYLRTKR